MATVYGPVSVKQAQNRQCGLAKVAEEKPVKMRTACTGRWPPFMSQFWEIRPKTEKTNPDQQKPGTDRKLELRLRPVFRKTEQKRD